MNKENLVKRVEEIVEAEGLLLIDSVIRGDNKLRIIEIYIDGQDAITTDICSGISRLVKDKIEEENIIDSNFRLDVSSPGVDRPLKYLKQYHKHLNRNILFSYGSEEKDIKSKLTGIEGNILTFNDGKNEIKVRFEEIKSAKVLISF